MVDGLLSLVGAAHENIIEYFAIESNSAKARPFSVLRMLLGVTHGCSSRQAGGISRIAAQLPVLRAAAGGLVESNAGRVCRLRHRLLRISLDQVQVV